MRARRPIMQTRDLSEDVGLGPKYSAKSLEETGMPAEDDTSKHHINIQFPLIGNTGKDTTFL